jgi:ribose transport system substrate-binding protein
MPTLRHLSCALIASAGALLLAVGTAAADDPAANVAAARAPQSKWTGPSTSAKPEPGESIYVITCASQGIGCVRAAKGVEEAGAALGWQVRSIDGRGDPATWNSAILSAVAAKANGIVLAAVPPMLVGDALQQAAAAKLPVVSVFNPLPGKQDSVFAYVRPDHVAQGKLAADWVAVNSGGKANWSKTASFRNLSSAPPVFVRP